MNKKSQLREWIEALVVAGAIAIFARSFFFQIYKIPTTSMVPTLMPGDKIFVSKLTYGPKVPFTPFRIKGFAKPQRGEVVVFIPPHDRKKAYIKRLIGLPGDKVVIKGGNIYINEKMVVDSKMTHYYYNQGEYAKEEEPIVVPEDQYFFLGDNSISSLDSRYWGFVDKKDVVGKAIFIWWPPRRITMIE
ncbi:MAG: signal peptidase I [Candidatus Omnitrophica bacterium]|nr:signal peptidase I [Candidatus Omnitrophota bacterium]